ncbi:hypothetical protein B0A55_13349 [Friedmanniomyces simplex]|uniref:D-isomer specific 2-hydroxyacid dehydrogenase NAD-binding domain-containing protein n=1 Tax=Friedmanniomyces simplex TaxID=329884 RepID=A0A4U0VUQ7_9PEZI|nr:hypothetical protein B0A55_13349 [Friedmanniomyces simplex]
MASPPTPTRLAILDDYSAIARHHFSRLPNLHIDEYPSTLNPANAADLETLVQRLQPYHILSTMRERTPLPAELIARLPNLKLILNASARNAAIDIAFASERGILVTGTKGEVPADLDPRQLEDLPDLPPPRGHSSVVQHTWALTLALLGGIPRDDAGVKVKTPAAGGVEAAEGEGVWQSGLMIPVAGRKLGIMGLGKLGVGVAKVGLLGFGMEVLAWSENLTQGRADEVAEGAGLARGSVRVVGREELFRQADVVSLHLVLSGRSRGVVGGRELGWMKKTAVLVNTSRGPLIDEEALIETLKAGGIRGAALDVYWEEPLPGNSVWRSVDSWAKSEVVLSPHMGYVNAGTMHRWYQEQAENAGRWMRGEEVLSRMS